MMWYTPSKTRWSHIPFCFQTKWDAKFWFCSSSLCERCISLSIVLQKYGLPGHCTEDFLLKYSDDHILFFTTAFLNFFQLEFSYMQTSVAPLYFGLLHFVSFMSFKAKSITPNVWFKTSVPLNCSRLFFLLDLASLTRTMTLFSNAFLISLPFEVANSLSGNTDKACLTWTLHCRGNIWLRKIIRVHSRRGKVVALCGWRNGIHQPPSHLLQVQLRCSLASVVEQYRPLLRDRWSLQAVGGGERLSSPSIL